MMRRIGIVALATLLAFPLLEMSETFALTGSPGLAQAAQARVGRPLTPVSVAGVGRRTVRRCAVGVYDC